MSKEIENNAIGILKEVYMECAKLVRYIYNGNYNYINVTELHITVATPKEVKDVPFVKWLGEKERKMLYVCGDGSNLGGKEDFWRLYSDSSSSLYNEIRDNIEELSPNKNILQGYVKGVLGMLDGWAEVEEKQQIDQQVIFYNGFILETWNTYKECKKHLEKNIKAILEEYGLQGKAEIEKPQQGKGNSGRGRQRKDFKDRLINDKDGKHLKKLHSLIDGKKGKFVASVIFMATKIGWIEGATTFAEIKEEFGDIGAKSGFSLYSNETKYTKEEMEGIRKALESEL